VLGSEEATCPERSLNQTIKMDISEYMLGPDKSNAFLES
jgi:hypothetical protein